MTEVEDDALDSESGSQGSTGSASNLLCVSLGKSPHLSASVSPPTPAVSKRRGGEGFNGEETNGIRRQVWQRQGKSGLLYS